MSHDSHLIESEVSSERVFDGALLHVRKDTVLLPNGQHSIREYIVHPGAVVVLAFLDNGNLLFERQFRYPLRRVFLELPAGKIDPGESIIDTARRELREETGYVASEWEYLGVMHPCIGYSDERIEIFAARGLTLAGERRSITTNSSKSSSCRLPRQNRQSGMVAFPMPRPSHRCFSSISRSLGIFAATGRPVIRR